LIWASSQNAMHSATVSKMVKKETKKEVTEVKVEQTIKTSACTDRKCVLHGGLPARGRVFEGIVLSDKMQKTVTVEWPRLFYVPKFERYEKRRSKVHAHNPACISAKTGERVRIVETRPLTKTVKFAVVEVMK